MAKIIGIDLGTTNSVVAIMEGDQPKVLVTHDSVDGDNDPELFAGLVHACRYCGLYEQSIAAHEEARRLDPNVPTSLEQTLLMTGDIDRLLTVTDRVGMMFRGQLVFDGTTTEAKRSELPHVVVVPMVSDLWLASYPAAADSPFWTALRPIANSRRPTLVSSPWNSIDVSNPFMASSALATVSSPRLTTR